MADEIAIYDQDGKAHRFALVSDGKRALIRNYRATNVSDIGRVKLAQWELATPIGYSKESTSGMLACDYAKNLETRFPRRLISKGARTAITLTSKDPTGVSSSLKLGGFKFGDTSVKMGGPISTSDNVTNFAEYNGYMYAFRGRLGTQVQLSNWSVIGTTLFQETVQGATSWYGKVRVGLGSAAPMRTLTSATSIGSVFTATQSILGEDIYAGPFAVGSDRCWYITRNSAGSLDNLAGYTLDDFATTANPFQVGDPLVKANGIGTFGPFTFVGKTSNVYTFTDQAKIVPLSRALVGHVSTNNGSQFADPGWGWLYAITDVGLRALTSHIDNPVGPGESMINFTGHSGTPKAIFPWGNEMFVVYETAAGDSYGYRCKFGPQTANTGQPLFYPWWHKASTSCRAIFATNTLTNPTVVWGEGTNMAYETLSREGRDDTFTSRTYDVNGGIWYGTEMDRDPHLLKVLRLARIRTKNITSGSSWTLAMSFDNGTYLDVGEVVDNGFHTIRPVDTGVPLDDISGHSIKPRLTQVAAGSGASTSPPEIEGVLEVEYDERPAYITEVAATINLSGTDLSKNGTISQLETLVRDSTTGPVKVRLPDENVDRWAMLQNVSNRRDLKPDGVEGIDLILHIWDVS